MLELLAYAPLSAEAVDFNQRIKQAPLIIRISFAMDFDCAILFSNVVNDELLPVKSFRPVRVADCLREVEFLFHMMQRNRLDSFWNVMEQKLESART